MPTTDRRHSSRTKPDQLAYLSIEPDNGGIVLNVSEDGLCFHSMAPIQTGEPLRLSLQELNRKIDLSGDLVWTDDAKKSGGVRFSTLTPEARARISDWIRQGESAGEERPTLGAALLKVLPSPASQRIARSLEPHAAWWKSRVRVKVSGFARGLAVGFVLALVAFSVLLFSYAYRVELGESLIRIGKRLGGSTSQVSGTALRPAPQPAVIPSASVPAVVPAEPKPPAKNSSHNESAHGEAVPDDVTVRLLTPPRPVATSLSASARPIESVSQKTSSQGGGDIAPQPGPLAQPLPVSTSLPAVAAPQEPVLPAKSDQLATSFHRQVAPSLPLSAIASRVQMFFDLGRFKAEPVAQNLRDQLSQIGIESTVVPKRRLWGNSYQVLAGPYDDDDAEKQIHTSLLSHGYKPRPFERGTRDFAFHSRLSIEGSPLPTGNFTVAWESYIGDAKVKFSQGDGLLAAVDGKWVKHPTKFARDEYVYQVQPNGSRPLMEIHFGGMDRALVFGNGGQ